MKIKAGNQAPIEIVDDQFTVPVRIYGEDGVTLVDVGGLLEDIATNTSNITIKADTINLNTDGLETLLTNIYNKLIGTLAIQLYGSNAKEPFSGSTTVTYTFTQTMRGLVVSNDGASALTFTVNAYTFTVNANEVWDYLLDPFTQVTITTTVAYRCWGRG
jgi:hypothetical protein